MPNIACTQHLREIGPSDLEPFEGENLLEALHNAGKQYPKLLNYILDDQGRVRQHVAIFINGTLQPRASVLRQPLTDRDQVYLLQALSGG